MAKCAPDIVIKPCAGSMPSTGVSILVVVSDRPLTPTDTAIDPFADSGTTLLTAANLGRTAIGVEIEERYCEMAARRFDQQVLPVMVPQSSEQMEIA